MADSPSMIVKQAFEDWMNGTGNVGRIFAPEMTWEVYGRSAASGSTKALRTLRQGYWDLSTNGSLTQTRCGLRRFGRSTPTARQ